MASEKSKQRESDACKKSRLRATEMSASRRRYRKTMSCLCMQARTARRYRKRRVACVYLLCELLAAMDRSPRV